MKHLLFCLFFVATLAHAGAENMVAQCEAVMACPLCRVANDTTAYPNGRVVVLKTGETRRISNASYNYLRNAGYALQADGRHVMCARVADAMKKPDSDRGLAARALFDSDWVKQEYCP